MTMVLAYRYQPEIANAPEQRKVAHHRRNQKEKPGVIDTVIEVISREKGGSITEITAILARRFPDRDETGMSATARVQANRHCSSKARDVKRGLVYFKKR
jgi:hypothetical protein